MQSITQVIFGRFLLIFAISRKGNSFHSMFVLLTRKFQPLKYVCFEQESHDFRLDCDCITIGVFDYGIDHDVGIMLSDLEPSCPPYVLPFVLKV